MTMKCVGLVLCAAVAAQATDQTWVDGGANNVWGAGAANWDAGVPWVNGSTAVFSGPGDVIEVDGAVEAAGIAFRADGYTVTTNANGDGVLTLTDTPVIDVAGAGMTGTIGAVVAGTAGFTKTGAGLLQLAAMNTYSGETVVESGILRLSPKVSNALGAAGTDNGTVVRAGATLDLNGAYMEAAPGEPIWASGSGVDGLGAIINTGGGHVNRSTGRLTLLGDTVVGGPQRIDINDITGNGHTFTKRGSHQLCVRVLENANVVINEGQYTLLSDNRGLGGTTWGETTVNGSGRLDSWGNMTVSERITFNGGQLSQGEEWRLFTLSGWLTVNSNVTAVTSGDRGVAITGFVDGPGGFTQDNAGWFILANPTNAYTGPTIVANGRALHVGWTNGLAGAWGMGVVSNYGDICFWSSGASGRGPVVNMFNGRLLFDWPEPCVFASNTVDGVGATYVRYGGNAVFSAISLTNANLRVCDGNMTLTNGTVACFTNQISVADLSGLSASVSNVNATLTIHDGCVLEAGVITGGNGEIYASLTGRIVQVGGKVRTTGYTGDSKVFPGEYDGLHLGHWPACHEFVYEMRGGELIVGNGYRLAIAIDGQGWFWQTGGEVYATTVTVNGRDDVKGFGRLTLEGGVLNVGSNGINAGVTAPYLVEYAGGTVRAVTNFTSKLDADMLGAGAAATVFDTQEWDITLSGNLTGTGGLAKAGSGTLTLTGANTYAGGTTVLGGTLLVNNRAAVLPDGAMDFGVAAGDAGGRIHSDGDLSLDGLVAGVANPEALDKGAQYTIATWGGTLTDGFSGTDLPATWKVGYNHAAKRAYLFADVGTMMQLR